MFTMQRIDSMRNATMAVAVLGIAMVTAGCSSSDNPTASVCMSFEGAAGGGGAEVRMQDAAGSTCDIAEIEILVSDVNGLFGAAFDLGYESPRVQFSGINTDDSVLGQDGNTLVVQTTDTGSRVIVGVSRTGSSAIDVVGTEVLCRVVFERAARNASTSPLEILNANLLDASGPPAPIPGVTWRNGTFTFVED